MAYKLDLKDRKLLYELDMNSRQTFSELAKKIKLSKNSVSYRINNLQKEGIIEHFYTVIDTGKLGYLNFRVYINLENTTPQKEQEIIEFLEKRGEVVWVMYMEGRYNLGFFAAVKSVNEFNQLWKDLTDKYVNYMGVRQLTVMINAVYFSKAYLIEAKKNEYEVSFSGTEPVEVDEQDLEILRMLSSNSRARVVDIADKLDISPKTVISKIRNLEQKKVIVGYKTDFDLDKMGYQLFKITFMLHNLDEETKKDFNSYIKSNPNITYKDEVIGGEDLEIELQVKDLDELREIIADIKKNFSGIIRDYDIMQFSQEHKCLFFPVK